MHLFWLENSKQYVRTQTEAVKSKEPWHLDDFPLDKDGLLKRLNDLHRRLSEKPEASTEVPSSQASSMTEQPSTVDEDDAPPLDSEWFHKAERNMGASAVLSRIDNPKHDVDGIVEAIGKSKMHALKRYAGAVAMRFQELSA